MTRRELSAGQKGFTLIEMSIVLVIIGLIIGGILKGQEIIESARQKNVITQVDALRAAINTFNDRYSGIPGDYNRATTRIANLPGLTNGGGNGVIGTDHATLTALNGSTEPWTGDSETQNFWCHLSAAQLIGESSTTCNTAITFFGDGSSLPSTAAPGSGMTAVYGLYEVGTGDRRATWVRVHRAVAAIAAVANGAFSGKQMYEMDTKTDDGRPTTGTLRSANIGTACPAAADTSVYVTLGTDIECAPYFEVGP